MIRFHSLVVRLHPLGVARREVQLAPRGDSVDSSRGPQVVAELGSLRFLVASGTGALMDHRVGLRPSGPVDLPKPPEVEAASIRPARLVEALAACDVLVGPRNDEMTVLEEPRASWA